MIKLIFICLLSLLAIYKTAYAINDDEILRAMRDELKRNMNELSIESIEKPYYIEYKLSVYESNDVKASLGSLQETGSTKTARISVDVRVGDYKFDNTNFFDFSLSFFGSGDDEESFSNRRIPIEPDYNTIRRELWLATDAAYKQSAEIYSKKLASLKNRVRKDTTHDFLYILPEKNYQKNETAPFDISYLENQARAISSVFKDYPEINASTVVMEFNPETTYYINSEGREYIKTELFSGIEIVASTQAQDGMPVSQFYSAYGFIPSDLPKLDSLTKAAKLIADYLVNTCKQSTLDESYSGPVLFEGQAAAEIFAQVFAPNLVTQREALTESGVQENDRFAAFQSKVGGRVLPEFLNIEAIPSKSNYLSTPLTGHYNIDDEGVKPLDIKLVEKGYLKALLSSRVPTKRVRNTNGSNRGGASMINVLRLYPENKSDLTKNEMKNKLIKLCKDRELPYGFIVRKVLDQNIQMTTLFRIAMGDFAFPFGQPRQQLLEVYKVFPDGREQIVRGCEAKGITVQSFKDIIAVSNTEYVMNYLAPAVTSPFMSGGDQYLPVSVITPDLLFEDTDISPFEGDFPKPPIMQNPLVIKK